jgi:hypothetical protein
MSVLRMLAAIALALGAGALMSACSDGSAPTEPSINPSFQQAGNVPHTAAGSVYLMSNAVGGNEVLVFRRASDGSLTPDASVEPGPAAGWATRAPSCSRRTAAGCSS